MPKDMQGRELEVGQLVAKAKTLGRSAFIEVREVAVIKDGKVYLSGAKLVPLVYPNRVLIISE